MLNTNRVDNQDHYNRYITFKLIDNLMGIDILAIREIVPRVNITPVQQAPDVVVGLINLRGQILTVLDVGTLFGFEKTRVNKKSHIIIFKHKNAGFIVDQIGDVIVAESKQIEPVPANFDTNMNGYLDHIIHLDDHIVMVLNPQTILACGPANPSDVEEQA